MGDVLVLCYHAVSERWPAQMAVRPERFADQLSGLLEAGYAGATFTDAVLSPGDVRTLAVTFDDAYGSVFRLAAPILERLGIPGTVFVPTAFPGSRRLMAWPGNDRWLDSPYEEELAPMSWSEMRALADSGWEVGSHSRTHPRLTALSDSRLMEELRSSRLECETEIGRPCRSLAYPFGELDRRVVEFAGRAGYEAAATLSRVRFRPPLALRWPRAGIYRRDGRRRFGLKVAPRLRDPRANAATGR